MCSRITKQGGHLKFSELAHALVSQAALLSSDTKAQAVSLPCNQKVSVLEGHEVITAFTPSSCVSHAPRTAKVGPVSGWNTHRGLTWSSPTGDFWGEDM